MIKAFPLNHVNRTMVDIISLNVVFSLELWITGKLMIKSCLHYLVYLIWASALTARSSYRPSKLQHLQCMQVLINKNKNIIDFKDQTLFYALNYESHG